MRKFTYKQLNILLHLKDGIESCRNGDTKQAEHNFFEIANHLGLKDEDIFIKNIENMIPLNRIK